MEKEKISIIVPCYKVEEFLPRCIDSICNQTYKNLEIILVDDGSPDNCGKICDEYSKKDKRIKVIHKKNGGLSDARNFGIKIATGDYIAFVDSDDYINKNMYHCLYNNLKSTKSDISICGFKKTSSFDENTELEEANKIDVYNKDEAFKNLYNQRAVTTVVAWNKLYKKKIFDNLEYPVGKINEDEAIIHLILEKTKKVVYTPYQYYYYYQRPDSIMNDYKKRNLEIFECFLNRSNYFEKKGWKELQDYNNYMLCYQSALHYNKVNKSNLEDSDKIKEDLKAMLKKYGKLVKKSNNNTFGQKIIVSLLMINPKILNIMSWINSLIRS